ELLVERPQEAEKADKLVQLHELLKRSFSSDELSGLVADLGLTDVVVQSGSSESQRRNFVETLERRNAIDRAFFQHLLVSRPGREEEIREVARHLEIARRGIEKYSQLEYYKIDVKDKVIFIYLIDQDINMLSKLLTSSPILSELRSPYRTYRVSHFSPGTE
ncbi:MAG: hypothetical protein AAFY57_20395, partial [Cyanobacteria bacterium J06642_2]